MQVGIYFITRDLQNSTHMDFSEMKARILAVKTKIK